MQNEYYEKAKPYLNKPDHLYDFPFDVNRSQIRTKMTGKYSWAIPNNAAIQLLVEMAPIIEIGAGSGYWAYLARKQGIEFHAFDKYLKEKNEYQHKKSWTKVKHGDENILLSFSPIYTLFLCWPPYNEQMAFNCLKNFKGTSLIYIGESFGGCTGDDDFHNELTLKWTLIQEKKIPRWPGMYDKLFVYKRNEENK